MATTTLTTRLKISSWEETPTRQFDDGSKVTRAEVVVTDGPDGLHSGTFDSLMYYRGDGTSHYVALLRATATLDGRSGSFVLAGEGGFDGTTASSTLAVVPGSGTEGLAGITGSCRSASTHADYPFMPLILTYDLG